MSRPNRAFLRSVYFFALAAGAGVWAAAGTDSAVFRIAPRTLRMLSNAVVAPFAETSWLRVAAASPIEPRLQFEAGAGA